MLEIKNLQVKTGEKAILKGVDLTVGESEVVALMGPNGSGKSTLASVLMGHPEYEVTAGTVTYNGQDVLALKPEERAKLGIFLAFQYPHNVAGVTLGNMLRLAYNATHQPALSVADFITRLKSKLQLLQLSEEFMTRPVNEGLSGGEKKRAEMLQLAVLEPRLAILDETDSGLDVDALKIVGEAIATIRQTQPNLSILLITHYQRMLEYVQPDRVAVMSQGRVVKEGQGELLQKINSSGFTDLT